ncbi:MAG: NAD(P)/FAD-dependent oxidoreductase [Alphaproteobacteria bacterium]|nr:NAD(P)/FAD-dependent oxidoreductase [Alphaproteobacteria bacterium]
MEKKTSNLKQQGAHEINSEVLASSSHETEVIIIGAGVAGMYASYCCSLANVGCVLVDKMASPGGQCVALYPDKVLYGVPGYTNIKAKDFIAKLSEQCLQNTDNSYFGYTVQKITRTCDDKFTFLLHSDDACNISGDKTVSSKYVIIATGIGEMKPNIPASIQGISDIPSNSDFIQFYCLNHTLYKGKDVVIAGGGDSAIDFALDLAKITRSLTVIHRRASFSCEESKISQLAEFANIYKIKLELEQNICLLGEQGGKRYIETIDKTGNKRRYVADHIVFCYGFVASPGNIATEIGVETEKNLVKVNIENMETSIKNCYAIGDVATYKNKKKNIVPCFFEADRAVRAIKDKISGG